MYGISFNYPAAVLTVPAKAFVGLFISYNKNEIYY